jgi:hypothetical protein
MPASLICLAGDAVASSIAAPFLISSVTSMLLSASVS